MKEIKKSKKIAKNTEILKKFRKDEIKFILFDLNDTILKHRHFNIIIKSAKIFGFKLFRALKEFNKLKYEYGKGKLSDKQIAEKVLQAANKDKKFAKEVTRIYRSNVVEMPEMLDLLKKLKSIKEKNERNKIKYERKYKIILLAGDGIEGIIFKRKQFKLDKYFDKIICTSDLGIHKDNQKFYKSSLKMIKARPKECLFIDDNKKFIATAESCGIRTIMFRGARSLKRELRGSGIL